jgi:signal transduction histidine kinase
MSFLQGNDIYMSQRVLAIRPEWLIAFARLALVVFALLAIILDPPHRADQGETTLIIAVGYLAFACLSVFVVVRRPPRPQEQMTAHIVDIVCVVLLIHLSEGPASPFFIFFTFIMLSATLRWDWSGAIWTTALIVLIFLLTSVLESWTGTLELGELKRIILRTVYLMVAGVMLAYVGAFQKRSRMRLAKLVAWPGPDYRHDTLPPIGPALEHAADILCAPRVLLIWEQPDEPFRDIALWSKQGLQYSRERPDRFGAIVSEAVTDKSFLYDPKRGGASANELIDADLRQAFSVQRALTAPFHLPACRGRIFLIDPPEAPGPDTILLAELIATRIGVDLEHHLLRSEREAIAALNERARLARDLHDGVLQGLAAANIHLKLSMSQAYGEVQDQLDRTRQLLVNEQQRIRTFVETNRSDRDGFSERVNIGSQIDGLLDHLHHQWNCDIDTVIDPRDLQTTRHIAHNVRHLLAEAVSNAVRHGNASRVGVRICSRPGKIEIRIVDNGVGIQDLDGVYLDNGITANEVGPRSIRSRVLDLGGSITLRSSPAGTEIKVEIPS